MYNNKGKQGFYWRYDSNEKNFKVFSTQMQSIYARRVFPCLDEPDLKAEFQVNVVRPKDYMSLSNTQKEIEGVKFNSKLVLDMYKKTPIMPTYLLAIVVAKYEHLESQSQK